MQTANETRLVESSGFTVRIRPPTTQATPRITLLIHGLTGDEDVMWVFANRLPHTDWFLAPRAPFSHPDGGYSWVPSPQGIETPMEAYLPMVDRLTDLIDSLELDPPPDRSRLRLIGFSQGAAMSLAFSLTYPERVERVAALAGFLPPNAEKLLSNPAVKGFSVFMAHGTLDEQVPIIRARQSSEQLTQAGLNVTFCEDEVVHKLSLNCLRGMNQFFQV